MATYSADRAKHATLTTTTVDTVTIGASNSSSRFGSIEVVNRHATEALYWTYTTDGSTPAVPAAGGDDTYYVAANSSMAIDINLSFANIFAVSIIGNGNEYSVHSSPRSRYIGR